VARKAAVAVAVANGAAAVVTVVVGGGGRAWGCNVSQSGHESARSDWMVVSVTHSWATR